MNEKIKFSPEDKDLAELNWKISPGGYVRRSSGKRHEHLLAHRLVLARMLGRELTRSDITDHLNGDQLDNRRENLRLTTASGNARNLHKARGSSGLFGVSRNGKKWEARLRVWVNGKGEDLFRARFDSPLDAARAYNSAAEHHGFKTRNLL